MIIKILLAIFGALLLLELIALFWLYLSVGSYQKFWQKKASKVVEKLVNENAQVNLVNLQKYTTENQSIFGFAPDLFRPNNLSYQNWANAFWDQTKEATGLSQSKQS